MLREEEEAFPVITQFCYVYEDSVNAKVKNNISGVLINCQLTRGVVLGKCAVHKTQFKINLLLSYPTRVTITNMISVLF